MKTAQPKIDITWASPNQKIWITLPPKEATEQVFKPGKIVNIVDTDTLSVRYEGDSREAFNIKGDKVFPLDTSDQDYNNLMDLPFLNEPEVINNIQKRYQDDQIFTYLGSSLVSVNPYKYIHKLFENKVLEQYQGAIRNLQCDIKELPSHIFAVTGNAVINLLNTQKNQAIVISGESGAGKTELAKLSTKFLASLARRPDEQSNKNTKSLEEQILSCNPILEAFGNAKTIKNDNSSRFGKYMSLLLDKNSQRITGAMLTNYLLEKSRICSQNPEERNYHIFYALIRGQNETELNKLHLTKEISDYECLRNDYKGPLRNIPDTDLFKQVTECFQTLNISEQEQEAIWTCTAATLLLNNLRINDGKTTGDDSCSFVNMGAAQNLTTLLKIDFDSFSNSLLYKTRVISGEVIQSTISKEECLVYRNSLAKEIYSRLFNWLIKRLNFSLMPSEFNQPGAVHQYLMQNYLHIGLLDIFGFEILSRNSLEQLFINYSMEKLHALSLEYIYQSELKEFADEGVKDYLTNFAIKDNQNVLDILDKINPMGILQIVDEMSSINSTDILLADKIIKTFSKPGSPFSLPRVGKESFIVRHAAKDVEYHVDGFRAKNKDELPKVIEDCLSNSTFEEVVRIWKNLNPSEALNQPQSPTKPNPRDKFLGYKFRMQMKELMEELNSCDCHFVRCFKPNEVKESDLFVPAVVHKQISYMGIFDVLKMKKANYPVRRDYKAFYQRYAELDNSQTTFEGHLKMRSNFKDLAFKICQKAIPNLEKTQVLFGNNKIFLKSEIEQTLENLRYRLVWRKDRAVKSFQKAWFRYKKLKVFRKMRKGIVGIQRFFKVRDIVQTFNYMRQNAKKIQKWWRRILYRRWRARVDQAAATIQAWWKMKFRKRKYLRMLYSSAMINRVWRGYVARRRANALRSANRIIELILHRGARMLQVKTETIAAIEIQRWARGHRTRCRHYDKVLKIRRAKNNFRFNKASTIIQKNVRGFITRGVIKRLNEAAFLIQGYMKVRWLSTIFQQLRVATLRIQKAFRTYLVRKQVVDARFIDYLQDESSVYEASKQIEQQVLFGFPGGDTRPLNDKHFYDSQIESKRYSTNRMKGYSSRYNREESYNQSQYSSSLFVPENIGASMRQFDSIKHHNPILDTFYASGLGNGSLNRNREVNPYAPKKIHLFVKILDIELLTDISEVYKTLWSVQALQLQNECSVSESDLQIFEIGQVHSLAVSNSNKVYSFGWNDCHQLGRQTSITENANGYAPITFPGEGVKAKSVASGDDHSLMLDYQGNLYIWGDNSRGQLGLGHCRHANKISPVELPTNDSIKEIKAKGNSSFVLTQSGKAYCWPLYMDTEEVFLKPSEICLPQKLQIASVGCGYNFAVLLAKNGLVFTFGKENQVGQLGHNDTFPRDAPALIESLRDEGAKMTEVSCGFKHVICKTAVGRVYTWGWGEKGQLGHGNFSNLLAPRLLSIPITTASALGTKIKALQVEAGFKHSVVFLEDKKIMWFGSNGCIDDQCVPIEVNLAHKVPNMNSDFAPVRVLCSWSKSLNITYVTLADTRAVQLTSHAKQKVLGTLISKLEEHHAWNYVDPPYTDSIANHFSTKSMKDIFYKEKKPKVSSSPTKLRNPLTGKYMTKPKGVNLLTTQIRHKDAENDQVSALYQGIESEYYANRNISSTEQKPLAFNMANNYETFAKEKRYTESIESSPSFAYKGKTDSHRVKEANFKSEASIESGYSTREVEEMSDKLREIKRRMEEIVKLPRHQWTITDAEFMDIALEPKMYNLLKNIQL